MSGATKEDRGMAIPGKEAAAKYTDFAGINWGGNISLTLAGLDLWRSVEAYDEHKTYGVAFPIMGGRNAPAE